MHDDSDSTETEELHYQRCCDVYGRTVDLDIAARGGRPMLQFPTSIVNPNASSESADAAYEKRKARILQGLDTLDQAIFLLLHEERCTKAEVATRLNISRQTVYDRLESMKRKSKYCRVSTDGGSLKTRVNQHG